MKFKNMITFSILIAFTFSIMHEYAFATLDENQCSISEFVAELDAPTGHDALCDTHFEYHNTYVLNDYDIATININKISQIIPYKDNYSFTLNLDLIIPPIS